jgi:CheY-like chemotaxis protein
MDGGPIKILLVEDDPEDIRLFKEALLDGDSAQYELTEASRLAEALAHLSENNIDLVLLDLSLPDEQGLDTLLSVRNHEFDIPIIVFTGMNDEDLSIIYKGDAGRSAGLSGKRACRRQSALSFDPIRHRTPPPAGRVGTDSAPQATGTGV